MANVASTGPASGPTVHDSAPVRSSRLYLRRALLAGAAGFVVKDTSPHNSLMRPTNAFGLRVVDPDLAARSLVRGESPLPAWKSETPRAARNGGTCLTWRGSCSCQRGRCATIRRLQLARRAPAPGQKLCGWPTIAVGLSGHRRSFAICSLGGWGLPDPQSSGTGLCAGNEHGLVFMALPLNGRPRGRPCIPGSPRPCVPQKHSKPRLSRARAP